MKSLALTALALAAVTFGAAEDDGQYHPERYGDDGKYRHTNDGQYIATGSGKYFGSNGKYDSIYSAYQQKYQPQSQFFRTAASQQFVNRFSVLDAPNGIDQTPFASSGSTVVVTARPHNAQHSRYPYNAQKQYNNDQIARILRQDQDFDANSYHYLYQTENGINAEEKGRIEGTSGTRASGYYEYLGDDGVKYRVDYTADENGFRPLGAHLPKVAKK